ncbi:MAG: tetratricopeptide repeat protein [Acetobacteraceae bacterium]|nr:tetratricopeptide repeat protein [Acetobacteraceae bacterium]
MFRPLRRSVLLVLSLLSACGAAESAPAALTLADTMTAASVPEAAPRPRRRAAASQTGSAALLTGRFATSQGDLDIAAQAYQRALAADMDNDALRQQAFLASLMAGRPEAERLAGLVGRNQAAQLMLAGRDAKAGAWAQAEARFAALPREGATEVMRPMLIAWAQLGGGQADAALATLQPLIEGRRFRAFYALHGALMADLADRRALAGRLYGIAQTEFGGTGHLLLGREVASWEARQGNADAAAAALRGMVAGNDDLTLALPGLLAAAAARQVDNALDGLADTYVAIASVLRGQESSDFALALTRLALQLRPDHTVARIMAAEIVGAGKRPELALGLLAPIAADDPLAPMVQMRKVRLLQKLERGDEALRLLDEVARAHPDRPEPLALTGDLLRIAKRFPEAVLAYDKAVALLDPPQAANWPLFYDRGIALERSKQWERAEADFLQALRYAPDQPHVLNYLGYSWTERGHNLEQARDMIAKAVQQRPNDGAMVDSLGWVAMRMGDTATAVRLLERAAELEAGDATVNGHLGDAYWEAGRQLEAVYQWRRALNLKPEPEERARIEERLRPAERALGIAP